MTEPPVCVPIAKGKRSADTTAADPDDEPPGVYAVPHGLRVRDGSKKANSVVTVLPIMIAPRLLIFLTTAASD